MKLQPASAADLPAHNPILPPAAITQVMLIARRPQVITPLSSISSVADNLTDHLSQICSSFSWQAPLGVHRAKRRH